MAYLDAQPGVAVPHPSKEPLNNKLYNLGNVAQPPPAVYRGKPQPGAAVPHIKLVNVIYFQAPNDQIISLRTLSDFFQPFGDSPYGLTDAGMRC